MNFELKCFPILYLLSLNCSGIKERFVVFTGESLGNILWNPGFPGIFAVCFSSGSIAVMELSETQVKTFATLPGSVKASASKYM